MQTTIEPYPLTTSIHQSLIFKMLPSALSNVPFHENTEAITRYVAEGFPMHLAIHEVSPVSSPPAEYTLPHVHDDFNEINIIVSDQYLLYKIQLDDDEYILNNNSSVWIPKGMIHSANVLEGSGFFITIRI